MTNVFGGRVVTFSEKGDSERLYYSAPGTWGRHEARIVGIGQDGRVSSIVAYTTHD